MTKYCTTVRIMNGPPGYCDVDYEYVYTDTPPTAEEQRAFINEHCAGYSHVRNIKTVTKEILTDSREPTTQ